ncbi:hypothetical protein J3459_008447 [Metarhizium acridum]|uniref:uncharacterized protein n=1 Tax=Metarhizium acridum TaxID=92637 RepID=UPI001C6B7404|nr:hypothetical protein J3458_000409 [Metarhizium acridum]KAG8426103.1 hypothetical protein J3459_008447 [Metarhizium acridum]
MITWHLRRLFAGLRATLGLTMILWIWSRGLNVYNGANYGWQRAAIRVRAEQFDCGFAPRLVPSSLLTGAEKTGLIFMERAEDGVLGVWKQDKGETFALAPGCFFAPRFGIYQRIRVGR